MTNLKPIVGFIAGLLTGSAVTYIFTKEKCKRKYARELNEVRKYSLESAKNISEQRTDVIKSTDILKRTEEGNIKSDETSQNNTNDVEFKERDVEQYHDYAKQYAPTSCPNSQPVVPAKKPDKPNKERPISPTDDHPMSSVPYAIDPDDFGDIDDYDTVYLTYFADGILAYDDTEETIDTYDLPETVGNDFKEGFGEYSDDTVWIRNNKTKIDYQIEKSHDHYYGDD